MGSLKTIKMCLPKCNLNKIVMILYILIQILSYCKSSNTSVISCHTYCHKDFISVEITSKFSNDHCDLHQALYWPNFHIVKMKQKNAIAFKIILKDFYKHGFIRITNKMKNLVTYYQNLLIKHSNGITENIPIKCSYKINRKSFSKFKHKLMKRDVLPEDFVEDDDIEILDTIEQKAAEPLVSVEVRQNDELINGLVTVIPGTPLVMEVKLNGESNGIYGLRVNYLQVSDTRDTSETILFRGCTVDPYLFENFNLTSKNSLKAKFRAFKFPNTLYVQFKINVEICLKRCSAPLCIASKLERLRQRREANELPRDQYEVSVGLIMKIVDSQEEKQDELLVLEKHVRELKTKALLLEK